MKNRAALIIVNVLLCVGVILASFSVNTQAHAQTQGETRISFGEVGVTDLILNGPFDSKSVSFSLPDNWELQENTTIVLYVQTFVTQNNDTDGNSESDFSGATLSVFFNQKLQSSVSLVEGEENILRIPIRLQDLDSKTNDGRIQISFFLDAGIDCDYGFQKTIVKISPESTLDVFYSNKTPSLDLRDLPRPIYKRDSYLPETAKVVISKDASPDELQSAYLIVSAFSRMTGRKLDLKMITTEQLTQAIREESHLIFVGKASSFPVLFDQKLTVPIVAGKFDAPVLQPDDGVIQMLVSPWNSSRVLLVVGGNSDEAVVKASQAVTTGNLQTSTVPSVSYIAQVAPLEFDAVDSADASFVPSIDYTLAELGYSITQAGIGAQGGGVGTQWFRYEFSIPTGQIAENDSYFDLAFSNSALIDPARSEISVFVNGNLAGSIQFDEEETSYVVKRIQLPPGMILPGRNVIDFAAELIPFDICTTLNLSGLWMTIFPESSIHVQLTEIPVDQSQLIELRNYPYPFLSDPSVSDLTIVLPSKSPESWLSFGDLVYDFGGRATGEVISFDVSFADEISDASRQNHLIFYGIPVDLEFDAELNSALPAPFEPGSNVAVLDNQTVVYRIEQNKSLGYLELAPSPWNASKLVLAVLGTNQQGLIDATAALIDSKIRGGLKGNFAVLDGDQFVVVDTQSGLGLGGFPSAFETPVVEEVISTPVPSIDVVNVNSYESTRRGILNALAVTGVAILIVIVIAFISKNRNRQKTN